MKRCHIPRRPDHDLLPLRVPSPSDHYRTTSELTYSRPSSQLSNHSTNSSPCRSSRNLEVSPVPMKRSLSCAPYLSQQQQGKAGFDLIAQNVPANPCSPLGLYLKENMLVEGLQNNVIIRSRNTLMEKWDLLPKEDRKQWESKSRDDQRRFKREMDDYRKAHWR